MKKMVSLALSIVVIVGLLAACSSADKVKPADQSASPSALPADQTASPAASATKEQKVVKISVRENTWGARKDNFLKAEKTLNDELAKDNVKVVIDWWPGIGDDELILQAQAGKIADVFINSSVDIGWELKGGLIREIDWVANSAVFKTVPASYTDIMKYDGHYYGAIQDMDASPVFINRKALKAIGWSDDQINGLKDQVDKGEFVLSGLVNLAEQAMKKNSVKIGFGVEDIRFEGWKYAFGSYTYNSADNKLVLSTSKDKEIYKFWYDAFHRGVIAEGISALDTDKAAESFLKGDLFAEFARTEFYQILRDKSTMKADLAGYDKWFNENVVWIPIPSATKGGKPVSFSNPAMIYVGSSVKEDKMPYVQQLIEHVLAPELQVDHTIKSGKLPVTPEAQQDPRFKEMPFLKDHAYMVEFTRTRAPHPDYATFVKGYTLGVESILTKGKTADEAYKLYEKDVKQNVPSDQLIIE